MALDITKYKYHRVTEEVAGILQSKTRNPDRHFFRTMFTYHLCKMVAIMRASVFTHEEDVIPINDFTLALGPSGCGKGRSNNTLEEKVFNQFVSLYRDQTFPVLAAANLPTIAQRRAQRRQTDPQEELVRLEQEFDKLGPLDMAFDSGSTAAVKQLRVKLLMADGGAVNFEMDEVGSNLLSNAELLNSFLELYDLGKIKGKLTKNTAENQRVEQLDGRTPANMLLFGTPSKLLDGSKIEDELMEMLEAGYGRRCFFAYVEGDMLGDDKKLSLEERAKQRMKRTNAVDGTQFLEDLSDAYGALADMINVNKVLYMSQPAKELITMYQIWCEDRADNYGDHDTIRQTEMANRHFKALKLAGAYAFIDDTSHEITEGHIQSAIKFTEDSGKAVDRLLTRDPQYVKLAHYLGNVGRRVTQHDLIEALPFFKTSAATRKDLLNLAITYGYDHNIIIQTHFENGLEFYSAETLQETDLDKMLVGYSNDVAYNYQLVEAPWDRLHELTQVKGLHWCNHGFEEGHRVNDKAIPGFNLIVLDVDGGTSLDTAKLLLNGYQALYYTTKRHQLPDDDGVVTDRFRIVLPTNYVLKLDVADYKEFMRNIFAWLPFKVDEGTDQRNKKWLSHDGHYEYTNGEVFDVLPFIPKTRKNELQKQAAQQIQSLPNLERWFASKISVDGQRNNHLLRYAMILVDNGHGRDAIISSVIALNDKLADPLPEVEIYSTIAVSVAQAINKRDA